MGEKVNLAPATKPSVSNEEWTKVLDANGARKALVLVNESASVDCRVALQVPEPTTAGDGLGFGPSFPSQGMTAAFDGPVWVYQASGDAWASLVVQEGF